MLRGGGVNVAFMEWMARTFMHPNRFHHMVLAQFDANGDQEEYDTLLQSAVSEYIYTIVEEEWRRKHRDPLEGLEHAMAAAGASSQASSSSGAGAGAQPVLRHTAAAVRRLRRREDGASGASGAPVTLQDFEIAKAVGEGDMKRLQTHVQAWLQRWIPFSDTSQQLSTQSIIRAQLGRGIWRGNLAGDFLPNPKIIEGDVEISTGKHQVLGVMGDGNCFYRALGVAMLLHPRLSRVAEEHLARVRYTRPTPEQMRENQIQAFRDTSMGLSMAYPLPGTALDMDNEIGRWRKDHYRLLRFVRKYNSQWGRTKRYSSTGRRLDFVERVARKFNARVWMDAALVRAMREMCATAMESAGAGAGAGATRQSVVEDAVTFDALRTGDMNVSPGVDIQAKIRSLENPVPWYIRHVVRQMWQDASTACMDALVRTLGFNAHGSRGKRKRAHRTFETKYGPAPPVLGPFNPQDNRVVLWHHGSHFDICNIPPREYMEQYYERNQRTDPFTASATDGMMSEPTASPTKKPRRPAIDLVPRHLHPSSAGASAGARAGAQSNPVDLSGEDEYALVTVGILNWLDVSPHQHLARMWSQSPLSHIKPATHYDTGESPSGVKYSEDAIRQYLGNALGRGTFVRRELDVSSVVGTSTVVVDFAHIFDAFPVDREGVASYRSAQLPAHVLSIGAARGAVGKALLRLPASCLLDPDRPITYYDKLVRVGVASAMYAPLQTCPYPERIIYEFLKRLHNVLFAAFRHHGYDMESIEQMIGDGNENHLGQMLRRTEDAQHREGLVEILAILLGNDLDEMYEQNGNFTTYAQVMLRKLLRGVRHNARLHWPALSFNDVNRILKDDDIIDRFTTYS